MTRSQERKAEKGDEEIKRLIEERRHIARGNKQHMKEVSKKIKKCIRGKKRARMRENFQRILEEFRGIKKYLKRVSRAH